MPNPATDKCTINIQMNEPLSVELSLYSLIGQQVWTRELGTIRSTSETIDIHELPEGIYIVRLKAGDQTYTTRLIRE
jgi:hypothetical protein